MPKRKSGPDKEFTERFMVRCTRRMRGAIQDCAGQRGIKESQAVREIMDAGLTALGYMERVQIGRSRKAG